jgi:polyhydroxyalkanoate synthesis repressor PhaR
LEGSRACSASIRRDAKPRAFAGAAPSTKRWPGSKEKGYAAQPTGANRASPMAAEPVTIKKYANRRLYNTGTSTYVTLEDLAAMVKAGEDFIVHDAKTGEDITRQVLSQIIFEQENKEGQSLMPITFLRQLIRFYGDSMQMLVPRYLEVSISSLTKEQEKFRQQMAQAFGGSPFGALEDQVRRNMEMFERAFAMFTPFGRREGQGAADSDKGPSQAAGGSEEIHDLKRQMEEMQKRLDRLSEKDKS